MVFKEFESEMHKHYNFDIKYKNQSLFMKFLGTLLFFNKGFMTTFITTIGSTIYFPDEEFILKDEFGSCQILAHELVHVKQANKYSKILFSFLYLFPQCLVFLALLAPISLWFLLFLVCILPIPAPFRTAFEIGGYTMSLFVSYLCGKYVRKISDADLHSYLEASAEYIDKTYFKGPAYWFMWPFGTNLSNKITDIENDVISGTDEIYNCVRQSYLNSVS